MFEVENFAQMSDEELKGTARSYHEVIYVYCCHSRRDLATLDAAICELERRGYEVFRVPELAIQKPDDEIAVPRPEKSQVHCHNFEDYSLGEAAQAFVTVAKILNELVRLAMQKWERS